MWFLISCVTLPLAAQNISLRARDITVLEVMERLQKDYGYSFSMEAGTIDVNRKVYSSSGERLIERSVEPIEHPHNRMVGPAGPPFVSVPAFLFRD